MRLTRNDARSGFESSVYQRRPVNGLTRAREEEGKGGEREEVRRESNVLRLETY